MVYINHDEEPTMVKEIANKYPGTCRECGNRVQALSGFAQLDQPGSKWQTICRPCRNGEAPAPQAAPEPEQAPAHPAVDPTVEQSMALAMFATGESFVIEAGAGCGKTSTARMMAQSTNRLGAFMAFNRKIVDDTRPTMPANMACKTIHGWARSSAPSWINRRLASGRQSSAEVARRLNVQPYYVTYGTETKVLQPGFLASHVMKALSTFCNSDDTEPSARHFGYIDGIDLPEADGERTYDHNNALRDELVPALQAAWADWQSPTGGLRYNHDAYLKAWALNGPDIPVDFIVVDEAQDLTGVMMQVLRHNAGRGVQVVAIGDAAQVIYEWRGTVSVFSERYADLFGGRRTELTTSFRFGQALADVANLLLDKAQASIRLTGNPDRETTVDELPTYSALLTRTNGAAVQAMFKAIEEGKRFYLIGGGSEVLSFAKAAQELQVTGSTSHPELACFTSWGQVQAYVENDPSGDELKLMVKMVDDHGADAIVDALSRQGRADQVDITISTVHKSKGIEFDTVRLGSDFGQPGEKGGDAKAEWRLCYVAATRAKYNLDISACGPIAQLVNPLTDESMQQADPPPAGPGQGAEPQQATASSSSPGASEDPRPTPTEPPTKQPSAPSQPGARSTTSATTRRAVTQATCEQSPTEKTCSPRPATPQHATPLDSSAAGAEDPSTRSILGVDGSAVYVETSGSTTDGTARVSRQEGASRTSSLDLHGITDRMSQS